METLASPPGPKGNIIFRPEMDLRNETHLLIQLMERKYGPISKMKAGPFYFVVLSKPEYIEHMFLNRDIYVKINEGGNLRYLLGNGLLTSEGEFWMKQRRLIQPVFHKQKLQGFVQKIADSTNEMLDAWKNAKQDTVDVYREMTMITLEIVGKTLLSTNVKGDFAKVNQALNEVLEGANLRRGRFIRWPNWVPIPSNIRMGRSKKVLDETILEIIDKRRKSKEHFDDLLTMLIEVEDADTAERMTDNQLRDEVLTIFIAGYETTANALSYTFYLLAKHPEVKAKVDAELQAVLSGNELTYDLLGKLEYLQMVIKESMRLYPPAWVTVREAAKDDMIDGYLIKKGDKIIASPYAMQHSENYWQNPEKFDPERFTPENAKRIPKYTYFPFGGGARLCIGNNFAMMEMQIVAALVCSKYNFTLPDNFKLELRPMITLRPKHGVPVKLHLKN
jgi:cytochrome P450